ncbi:MAG: hypothetical protein JXR94_12940 [Candidatus Hydrogenedentes bacterium]|nr:hypothetical protein [Candidatus Hydrogenedentota bacterium]
MAITYRSVIIGLLLMPLNALWLAVGEFVFLAGEPSTLSLFPQVIFMLFWLAVANQLVKRLKPLWALKPAELLVVYTMLCLGTCLTSIDLLDCLVPILSHLDYFGPMNNLFQPFRDQVPDWLVVSDPAALEGFYQGQESVFKAANLVPWLRPLAWWSAFLMALFAIMWGLNLVFRKQWTENEKLSYPIIQVPMALANDTERLFRNKYFWLAFGLAGAVDLLNGLSVLFPLLPDVPLVHIVDIRNLFAERPWRDMGAAPVSFYPFAIGMCFFMPLDLAFSCWFFFLFWKLQRVWASHVGIQGMPGFPFIEEQTAGGYYAMALMAIWISRRHLARLGRILLGRNTDDVSPWERQEAWIAAASIAAGAAFLLYFCMAAGMSPGIVVAFFLLYYLIAISVTRMRAELGPPSHDLHFIGPNFQIVKFFGAPALLDGNPRDLTMFGLFYSFNRAYRAHPMPHGLEAFRIAERLKLSNRRYLIAMAIALAAGIVCGFWALLYAFNKYGAAAQSIGPAQSRGWEAWNQVNAWFTTSPPHQWQPTYAIIIGLVFALGLAAMRMNAAWWPLHPVGYAISGSWSMEQLWMSVFTAWLIKAILLKYGGAKAYRPAVPFFLGLIVGDMVVGTCWLLYGTLTHAPVYHFWPY